MKKEKHILSTMLFTLSAVLLLYAAWVFSNSHRYISEMIEEGQLMFSGNEYEIVNFYVSEISQYVLFAVLFIILGIMMRKIRFAESVNRDQPLPDQEEEDIEEWLETLKTAQGNKDKS